MADGFTVLPDEEYARLIAENARLKAELEKALDPTWPKEEQRWQT